MNSSSPTAARARKALRRTAKKSGWDLKTKIGVIVVVLAIVLGLSWAAWTSAGAAGKYPFQVGTPRPGAMAPAIRLASARATIFHLASLRAETVLLYFQEGTLGYPSWAQAR